MNWLIGLLQIPASVSYTHLDVYKRQVLDRIIQECVRLIIEPICEARFYPHSYGFRPYRAQKHAIRDIVNVINAGCKSPDQAVWAVEGDIQGCFDTVSYTHLAASSQLIEEGLMDYRAHGGKGNSQDVADFIEREFLSEEAEPASLEIAKEFINDFCEAEYGSPADFSDCLLYTSRCV